MFTYENNCYLHLFMSIFKVMRKFQAKDPVDNFEEYLSYLHQLLTSKKE